jgi:hypothetical protein
MLLSIDTALKNEIYVGQSQREKTGMLPDILEHS